MPGCGWRALRRCVQQRELETLALEECAHWWPRPLAIPRGGWKHGHGGLQLCAVALRRVWQQRHLQPLSQGGPLQPPHADALRGLAPSSDMLDVWSGRAQWLVCSLSPWWRCRWPHAWAAIGRLAAPTDTSGGLCLDRCSGVPWRHGAHYDLLGCNPHGDHGRGRVGFANLRGSGDGQVDRGHLQQGHLRHPHQPQESTVA
mmetsp:Transcript_50109/g.116343  ORF Transcript_50109/g.116343 Transcript_50109/m.116343 type:complete len:201 (+) Transcript_50109:1090-1692(+)